MTHHPGAAAAPSTAAAPIRVLVTGSVRWRDRQVIEAALARHEPTEVITGMAEGADEFAREWAIESGVVLRAELLDDGPYPDPMHDYNHKMLGWEPTIVLAFKDNFDAEWAHKSCTAGTEHMCRIAAEAGIPVVLNDHRRLS